MDWAGPVCEEEADGGLGDHLDLVMVMDLRL